jgi:hypothetical protein
MAEENSDKRLIDAFQSFSPGLIYTLGPKREVVQGFLFYRKETVKGLAWTRGDSELAVSFRDSHSREVKFSFREDRLFSQCACGGASGRGSCRHIICALVTVKNLLNPALFKQPIEDARRRESLLTSLMAGQKHLLLCLLPIQVMNSAASLPMSNMRSSLKRKGMKPAFP